MTVFNNVYQGKRVFVTGHTGFKGSWLAHWLLQLGANVTGYSLYIPSQPSNFEVMHLQDRLHHITGDIQNQDQLFASFQKTKPEIIFHLAAQAIVKKSYDDPKGTFDTNLGGTVNLLEAIRKTPSVRAAVIITSDKCYDNVEWDYGYRETDRLGGQDPYSASKACAEVAFNAYFHSFFKSNDSIRLATSRAGNVIGGGDWAPDRIVPDCIRSWSKKETVVIRNPNSTRPWQHVLEPLSGYLWLCSRLIQDGEGLSGEAFNFGPSAEVTQSVVELIDEMKKTWVSGTYTSDANNISAREASLLKLSCDKALKRLGWKASLTFPETVNMTAQWYHAYYAQPQNMIDFTNEQISKYQELARQKKLPWVK